MKNLYFVLAIILLLIPERCFSQKYLKQTDAIQEIVSEINADSVKSVIQKLQNFTTRYMGTNRKQIYTWIKNKFISYGYTDVTVDSFDCYTNGLGYTKQYNVIAKLAGSANPLNYYIIGGHYDSYSKTNVNFAPGADDNASGTAAVLESARAIKKKNYNPSSTLLFITFGAEELMLYGDSGSEYYARTAANSGMNIKLMINNDMIAYSSYSAENSSVSINYYTGFTDLLNYAAGITKMYSKVEPVSGALNQYSDSQPFAASNFPAIYFEELQFSPYYHSSSDVVDNYNMPYCAEIIKASCAMLLSYSEGLPVSIDKNGKEQVPTEYSLCQNYPNPFNPSTKIKYSIPESGRVIIKVFDMLGREIETLVNEEKSAGNYEAVFNAKNLASGTYIYRIFAGKFSRSKKFILVK